MATKKKTRKSVKSKKPNQQKNKAEKPEKGGKRVYKWYLILAMLYSSIAILFSFLGTFIPNLNIIVIAFFIWMFVVPAWLLFNLAMLAVMVYKKIERIALLLPALYLFDFVFSLVAGMAFGLYGAMGGMEPMELAQNPILIIIGLIFPVVTLLLAVKLYKREKE